jgi:TPR repeat protein
MKKLSVCAVLFFALCASALAADIGGWFEQQSRPQPPATDDDCPALLVDAGKTDASTPDAAQLFYATGLCYLHSNKVARDAVAAAAWLTKAAELDHPLARRALLSLRERGSTHAPGYHCHELGMGRRLCHGQQPSL